ncbi:MAG: replication-associated recombination protein A, partial [Myxococcales bacterium]|nr:replication-associated recombination protein A [Myxococcales bacterium]
IRGSDPDAAVYWLARMLEAGEDPVFVARRIVIFASEDVGNADPQALVVARAAAEAAHMIGMPEAVLCLSQATLYMALAPKSNAALRAYSSARKDVKRYGALPVPLAVRNAVTPLMKQAQYGVGYRYPHDLEGGVDQEHGSYLPEAIVRRREREGFEPYVQPSDRGWEGQAARRLGARRSGQAAATGEGAEHVVVPGDAEGRGDVPATAEAGEPSDGARSAGKAGERGDG